MLNRYDITPMKAGAVVLVAFQQANQPLKYRPAIVLRFMLPFSDGRVCGISTQLRQQVIGFDEIIDASHADFPSSGIKSTSLMQLGFLAVFPVSGIIGRMGYISPQRHQRLLQRLATHLYSSNP